VGPYDLSASMGLTGQFDNREFLKTMETIKKKATRYGIPMGAHLVQPDLKVLQERVEQSYQFLAYSIDSVFLYQSAECPVL
jgi:2-dehydro-3-deoxyglucarate aldolase